MQVASASFLAMRGECVLEGIGRERNLVGLTERPEGTALLQHRLQVELPQVVQGVSESLDDKTRQLVHFGFCRSLIEAACRAEKWIGRPGDVLT